MKLMATKSLRFVCATTLLLALQAQAQQPNKATNTPQEKTTQERSYLGDRGIIELVSKFKGPNIKGYMTDVILRVRSQRAFTMARKTPIYKPGKLVVEFAIHRDGGLEYTKLIKTSGDQSIDQALIDAIQGAVPFQPLSPEFKDKPLKLRWHMEFKPDVLPSSSL